VINFLGVRKLERLGGKTNATSSCLFFKREEKALSVPIETLN